MKKQLQKKQSPDSMLKLAIKSAIIGLAASLIILMGFATLIMVGFASMEMSDDFVICSVIIGATLSGAICAKKREGGVITAGMIASGVYLSLILAISVFTAKDILEGSITMKIIIAASVGGCFGGALQLYRKTKKSKIRKKI